MLKGYKEELVEELVAEASLCMVRKVWMEKNFNSMAFMETMKKIWKPKHGLMVKEIK